MSLADPGVWKGCPYGERGARAYNGHLGALPWSWIYFNNKWLSSVMKIQHISFFPLIHDKCQIQKKPFPSLHKRDAFHVSWANHHRSLLVKNRDIERSKIFQAPVRGQGAKPSKVNVFLLSNSVHFQDENSMYHPIFAVSTIGKWKSEMSTGMKWIWENYDMTLTLVCLASSVG